MNKNKSIGIDLGTTNCCVSHINSHGQPEVIPSQEGGRTIPSVFAIAEDGSRLVGKPAVDQEAMNAKNTIRSIKRKMGTSDRLIVDKYTLSPEEISAEILKKIKADAEAYLNETITQAVITVPAYFNNDQRQSTKIAGELAGLKVLRIINEPTAASLAYGLEEKKNETVLVFDLGGGTFDVTVLDITEDGIFDVKSTAGDTYLGGDDFDQIIIKILFDRLEETYTQYHFHPEKAIFSDKITIILDEEQTARIREAAEQAKIQLSSTTSVAVNIPYLTFGYQMDNGVVGERNVPIHLKTTLTRVQFEEHPNTLALIAKIQNCVNMAVKDAQLTPDKIDEVVFVGGSTRVPLIGASIEKWLNKRPNRSVNPDEAVGIGAAIQAAILTGERKKDILLLDITPLSLGIETLGGVMATMIKRNTTIPVEYSDIYTTAEDNQEKVTVRIYQGERPQVKNNKFLGELVLMDILPAPRGVPKIEVIFDIDANGILSVITKDSITEKEQNAIITGSSSLSSEEIQKIIKDAEDNQDKDRAFKNLSDLITTLQQQLIQIESILRDAKDDLTEEIITELETQKSGCESLIEDLSKVLNSDTLPSEEDLNVTKNLSETIESVIKKASEHIYNKADELIQGDDCLT